jgi:hypothetical protein
MADQLFRCRHCRKLRFRRSREQHYCGSEACQKARKNAWRRNRVRADVDYRANQLAATRAWLESQGGSAAYHRRYRQRRRLGARHGYELEPTAQQTAGPAADAKSDAETAQSPVKSGIYRLVPCDAAKSDAIIVQLSVISGGCG